MDSLEEHGIKNPYTLWLRMKQRPKKDEITTLRMKKTSLKECSKEETVNSMGLDDICSIASRSISEGDAPEEANGVSYA